MLLCWFMDIAGTPSGCGAFAVGAGKQVARLTDQPPFKVYSSPNFQGTLTFSSNVPVAAMALRGLVNERGDFLMSALPVIDISSGVVSNTLVAPHFAEGGGWTTQLLLVNPTDEP